MQNIIGWREWAKLPALGIPAIKCKIDTGALTSCLHAHELETVADGDRTIARFRVQPLRRRPELLIECEAPVVDRRVVRDSGGHEEERLVILTRLELGPIARDIEFTLTSRDNMLFRVLIGRRALASGDLLVDVNSSYCFGRVRGRYEKLMAGMPAKAGNTE